MNSKQLVLPFRFTWVTDKTNKFLNLFKIFNISPQDIDADIFQTFHQQKVFKNVRNRRNLYIHSSIANTVPYNYLGRMGEFYMTPSKFYKWTSKSSIFRLWVTLNGQKPVHLYWQPFIVQFQLLAQVLK
jgi:hypothetical protein